MSIISRRQKNLLLSDIQRMINNNNHTAFANQAKIAECVSNGDLKFYIDSPKKEFVIRYGNKEIRFNCSDQQIKELEGIKFNNGSCIKGISDSSLIPSSNIALSTAWGSQIKTDLTNHNHDNKYADINHNHDNKYADINHTHNNYADKAHQHQISDIPNLQSTLYNKASSVHRHQISDITNLRTELDNLQSEISSRSLSNHTHTIQDIQSLASTLNTLQNRCSTLETDKAEKEHTHEGLWTKKSLQDLIKEETKTPWYIRLFHGIEMLGELSQDGYIAGLQAQITAIYEVLVANGLVDSAQTVSGLGSIALGVADKFDTVSNIFDSIGERFKKVKGFCDKISGPIKTSSNYIKGLQKSFDGAQYFRIPENIPTQISHQIANPSFDILPSPVTMFSSATVAA